MKSERINFKNKEGDNLSGYLDLPLDRKPAHYAVFAHCFTCGKDLKAVKNLTLALSQQGFGVLRFDFTGLGRSEGDFSDTNFSSNVEDINSAVKFLAEQYQAPELLVGHSLGGAAVLMAGSQIDSVKAIATVAAPCDPSHVLGLLKEDLAEIKEQGKATVTLAGRSFNIRSQFVEDLGNQGMKAVLQSEGMRGKALLIMHSPQDELVSVSNARDLYESARHPKSFIGLEGADHLLSKPNDSCYVGELIGSWVKRYLSAPPELSSVAEGDVRARIDEGPFLTQILAGKYHLLSDEPQEMGGDEQGPTPYQLVASGLGACTAMTLKMYAAGKKWPLKEVEVQLSYDNDYKDDCAHCEDDGYSLGRFNRSIKISGDLDAAQRQRLLEIANRCPVHKTLAGGVKVETRLSE